LRKLIMLALVSLLLVPGALGSVTANTSYLGFVNLLPVLIGVFCLVGAVSLSAEEHGIFKMFLFLFSFVFFFSAFHLATLTLVEYFAFPVLIEALADINYYFTVMWVVMVAYFLIYSIHGMVRQAAQDKEEGLKY